MNKPQTKIRSRKEVWKTCSLNDRYMVSNKGRVKLVSIGTIQTVYTNHRTGYGFVQLYDGMVVGKDGKKKTKNMSIQIHRLIALEFLGERKPGMQVDHINGNKLDNRVANLRYITQSANILRSYENGRIAKFTEEKHKRRPDNKFMRWLDDNELKKVIELFKSGISQCKIAKMYDLDNSTISKYISRYGNGD